MTHEQWQRECEKILQEEIVEKVMGSRFACDFLSWVEDKYGIELINEVIDWKEKTKQGKTFYNEELNKLIDALPEEE